jgi:hypothetical protein
MPPTPWIEIGRGGAPARTNTPATACAPDRMIEVVAEVGRAEDRRRNGAEGR